WSGAGIASLLLAAVIACAPSLAPAFALVWVLMMLLTAALRSGRGITRILWLAVPTAVVFAPLVVHRVRDADYWSVSADPGVPFGATEPIVDAARRLLLAVGFPTADPGGWGAFLGEGAALWWVPLLIAPLLVCAVLAPLTARPMVAVTLLFTAATGLVTAFLAAGVALAASGPDAVTLWPGGALSLAWAGLLGAALLSLDLLPGLHPRARPVRLAGGLLIVLALAVVSVPALTAPAREASVLTSGPVSTLPAYV